MIPASFSATSIETASKCLSRYTAEQFHRGSGMKGTAASLGTAVHGALELYVKAAWIEEVVEKTLKQLIEFFDMSFIAVFGDINRSSGDYKDGLVMLTAWFDRDNLSQPNRTIISCEQKLNFEITVDGHAFPFNYIWDRCDQTAEDEITVVDYKTNRWSLTHDELRQKIQSRCYAVAAMILYPNMKRIWIEFDMLRHEGQPIAVCFTRDQCAETWLYIKRIIRTVINTHPDKAPETINDTCLFCVRKVTCAARLKVASVGGLVGLEVPELVDTRSEIENIIKANAAALKEIDDALLTHAKEEDSLTIEGNEYISTVGARGTRVVDPDRAEKIIGSTLWNKYGARKINMGDIDKLLKGNELTDEKKVQLKSIISKEYGNPTIKSKKKDTFAV